MEKYLCLSELIFRFLCAFCVHVYDFVSIIIPGNTVHKEHKPINPTLPTNVGGILLHALDGKKILCFFPTGRSEKPLCPTLFVKYYTSSST